MKKKTLFIKPAWAMLPWAALALALAFTACPIPNGGDDDNDVTDPSNISAPANISANASGSDINLSWSSVSGAAYYKVHRSASADTGYSPIADNVSGTYYTNSGLPAGTYYYKVSAVSSNGTESPQSGYASATISAESGAVGRITGTVSFTGYTGERPEVRIGAAYYEQNGNYGGQADSSGRSYAVGDDGSFSIPFTQGFLTALQSGDKNLRFTLYISSGNSSYNKELDPVEVKSSQLTGPDSEKILSVGSLGPVNLASLTLSGTLKISNGGSPVPKVYIWAYKKIDNTRSQIGSVYLESPATGGADWSLLISEQETGTEITFEVYASDADGNSLFRKEFSPDKTKSVSNQPVSGIELDAGDISAGRMSGTVTFTNMPSPPPYRISINAYYGYSDTTNGKYVNNGSSTPVTLNGNSGAWSMSRDDDFLAALESRDQPVRFYLSITLNEGENSNSLDPIEKTVTKNEMGAVDLGSVAIPSYIKLSGTFTGTYNGGTLPNVYFYPRTQEGKDLGNGVSLRDPSAGTAWSLYIAPLDSPAKVVFSVSANSGSTSLFPSLTVSPSQTQAVSNQPVTGIVIDIGDIKPDTLRVANYPQGNYTAYVTDTSISQNNYTSVSGSYKATGTGSGSPLTLTWNSSVDKSEYQSYHVLISAGNVTKYQNYISFTNGTGSIDWNDMTEVSGGGGNNGGGGGSLAGAKGKLTLTGFNEFNGKYVYSALVTASNKALIGMNGVEITGGVAAISMVRISGGSAEVPLYTMNTGGTTVADLYVPYEGSEGFQAVSIIIVNDADGKFSSSDAAGFAANYAAMIGNNPQNTSFTPSTSGGNITISRSEALTMTEMGTNYTSAKYMLTVNPQ